MGFKLLAFLFVCVAFFSFASAESEISAHYRSARPGVGTAYVPGGRFRHDRFEGLIEYDMDDENIRIAGGAIWRFNAKTFFQPHLFAGAGYYYGLSLVPGAGVHLQFGPFAVRWDLYFFLNFQSSLETREHTYGLSWTF